MAQIDYLKVKLYYIAIVPYSKTYSILQQAIKQQAYSKLYGIIFYFLNNTDKKLTKVYITIEWDHDEGFDANNL